MLLLTLLTTVMVCPSSQRSFRTPSSPLDAAACMIVSPSYKRQQNKNIRSNVHDKIYFGVFSILIINNNKCI